MASSTDVIGFADAHCEDAALVPDVMAGQDPLDGTTIDRQERLHRPGHATKGKKLALLQSTWQMVCSPASAPK